MVDHGAEDFASERIEVNVVHDAHGQRGMLLHAQVSRQGRQSHQPQSKQIAAIKGEVEERREIDQEGIGEILPFVEDENRRDAPLVDQVQQAFLDVAPQFGAAMGGAEAELQG